MQLATHVRIDVGDAVACRRELRAADVLGAVQDLALEVARFDDVEVDQAERSDAGGRQIECERRSESAGADQQDARLLEPALAVDAQIGKDEVAAVSSQFFVAELGKCRSGHRVILRRSRERR